MCTHTHTHAHRPDVVDYSALRPGQHIVNLNTAFDVAEKELGLPRLLDAEGRLCTLWYMYLL